MREQHAVLIHVAAPEKPDEFGLDLIEDPLMEVLEGSDVGEYDSNEIGWEDAVIYLYGRDADRHLKAVLPTLRASPLPRGSYAINRYGEPGAQERRVELA